MAMQTIGSLVWGCGVLLRFSGLNVCSDCAANRGGLEFPADLSPAAVDLLKNLLHRDANERLGAGPLDAEEIKVCIVCFLLVCKIKEPSDMAVCDDVVEDVKITNTIYVA